MRKKHVLFGFCFHEMKKSVLRATKEYPHSQRCTVKTGTQAKAMDCGCSGSLYAKLSYS